MSLPKKLPLKGYWGSVLMLAFCIYLVHQGRDHRRELAVRAVAPPVTAAAVTLGIAPAHPPPPLPESVHRLHGHRNVFLGPQLDEEELQYFLSHYAIDVIIDFAGEAPAEDILTDDRERQICQRYDAHYWALNIEAADGGLNEKYLAFVDEIVKTGVAVFIHCRHGAHRAKVPAGRALARAGYAWKDIVDLLQWGGVVADPRYARYTDHVRAYVEQQHAR